MADATVSLCMIVRDEAEMLPAFLAAARGMYDELCVVDTGSTDATPQILAAAGARVAEMPWRDDFATARNASLDLATCAWTLCLDPDEHVDAQLVDSVRRCARDPAAGAATVAVRSGLAHGYGTTSHLLRMFRRDPSIRFAHAIHEDATASVLAYLARTGTHVVALDGYAEHLGYRRARAAGRDKKARDSELLRAAVAADVDDLYSWFKLLELGRYHRDAALVAEVAPAAARALAVAAPERLANEHYIGELLTLVAQGLFAGAPHDTRDYLLSFADRIGPSAAFWLRLGECHELIGELPPAIAAFERCTALRARTANVQLATTRPLLGLARLALAAGEPQSAFRLLDMALRENPRDPEALLAMVALARRTGGDVAAREVAAAHRETHGETAELRGALGELALDAGDTALALRELRAANAAVPDGPYAALLARAEAQATA